MDEWLQTLHRLDDEPNGGILVIAGPHNGDATWSTPHLRMLKEQNNNQRLIICCPAQITDIFKHNPYVDRIEPLNGPYLQRLSITASELQKFSTVIPPTAIWFIKNKHNLLRTQQYLLARGYPVSDIRPDLYISTEEIDICTEFMSHYKGGPKFMVETFNHSRQSAFNVEWLNYTVQYVTEKWSKAWFFVPCSLKELAYVPKHPQIVPIQQFTIRQCGFLANFCDYFLSCSSGISHACSSKLTKTQLPWLEIISHEWHSTRPYNIDGRKYYIGVDMNSYFTMMYELLTTKI